MNPELFPCPVQPNVLIALGKNIGVDSTVTDIQNNPWHLSTESRLTVLAAGQLYTPGRKLIFSGGNTAGEDTPSEARAMCSYYKRIFPDFPDEDIVLEERSIDTASNAEEVVKLTRAADLLSVGYHVENAKKLFEAYGVHINDTFASEEVLMDRSAHHAAYAVAWSGLKRVKTERRKEMVRGILLHTIDPRGKLLQKVTQRSRG